jgi:hypothetical protein
MVREKLFGTRGRLGTPRLPVPSGLRYPALA